MSAELEPAARNLIQLAKRAEQELPRNKQGVQRKVMIAVGAAASTTAAKAAASSISLASVLKVTALVSSVALVSVGARVLALGHNPESSKNSAPSVANARATSSVAESSATPAEKSIPLPQPAAERPLSKPQPKIVASAKRPIAQASASVAPVEEQVPNVPDDKALSTQPHSLSADLQVLREAQQALSAGAPARAIAVLHKIQGQELVAERTAIEVFALCALGNQQAAQTKAELFRRIARTSPLLPRVNASCAKP